MRNFLNSYWRSILWFSVITLVSLVKKVPIEAPKTDLIAFDKLVHFILYFTLSLVIFVDGNRLKSTKPNIFLVLLFPIVWGGIIEILQGIMATPRAAEWGDFFADALGSLLVWFVIMPVYRRHSKP